MIDLREVLERQEEHKKNPFDILYLLSNIAMRKRAYYFHTIMSSIETVTFHDHMTLDHVKMEYTRTGKYHGQCNPKFVDIFTGDEKVQKLKAASSDGSIIKLETACELYGEIVQESLEASQVFTNFKIITYWQDPAERNPSLQPNVTGNCAVTFNVVKE